MGRFEPDGTSAVVVSCRGEPARPCSVRSGARELSADYLAPAVVWRTGRPARVDEDAWSSVSDPVADALREAGSPVVVGEPDHRRGPPVGRGDRVDEAGRFRRTPPTAWPTSPSWSPRPSGTPRAGPSWPPRGRGSWPPRMRPGGGSSGTCTTGPSSGWSPSAWSFASPRPWCPPSCLSWRRRSAGWRTNEWPNSPQMQRDVHEVGPLVAGDETLKDARLDVAEPRQAANLTAG